MAGYGNTPTNKSHTLVIDQIDSQYDFGGSYKGLQMSAEGELPDSAASTPEAVTSEETTEATTTGSTRCRKYASLVVLCVMNASATLMIHYSRTRPNHATYLATTAVFFQEMFKVIACLVIIAVQEKSVWKLGSLLNDNILKHPWDCLKVAVPSFVYIIQNNLVFVALTNLDAATFQVLFQLRIITTALFSVLMLRRSLAAMQWLSLATLFIGISIVQLQTTSSPSSTAHAHVHNPVLGFICVLISALLSGFAGVYFERILKSTPQSIWLRNIQLGTIGLIIAVVYIGVSDWTSVTANGVFVGYDGVVWFTIILQAISGLSVAAVIKFADNILKTFATALAIIISCVVSYYAFSFHVTTGFTVGAIIVVASALLYNKFEYKPPPTAPKSCI